jgi:hypothetical protein
MAEPPLEFEGVKFICNSPAAGLEMLLIVGAVGTAVLAFAEFELVLVITVPEPFEY